MYHHANLGSSERVPHGGIGGKGQDGYEHGGSRPEVDTQSIEVLPPFEAAQL